MILCPKCRDIVALTRYKKKCRCGLCYGRYTSDTNVRVSGASIILGYPTQLIFVHDTTDVLFDKPQNAELKYANIRYKLAEVDSVRAFVYWWIEKEKGAISSKKINAFRIKSKGFFKDTQTITGQLQ